MNLDMPLSRGWWPDLWPVSPRLPAPLTAPSVAPMTELTAADILPAVL